MGTLSTVREYIADVRTTLQDMIPPYRYDDVSLLVAFNVALLETRRLRADLFVYRHHNEVPSFSAVDDTEVCMEPQFRLALVFGTAGHALARDQEDTQDNRYAMFMGVFNNLLLGQAATPRTAPSSQSATKEAAR